MDLSYLHLIQMLLLVILLCSAYHLCAAFPFRRRIFVFVSMGALTRHPVYRCFSRHLRKDQLHAFDKYQIWRYIEKRKTSGYPF